MNVIPDFDATALDLHLKRAIGGLSGDCSITPTSGGQSNPTYFVTYGSRELVLRKQPASTLLPSAHAIDREFRVMRALAKTPVPVPQVLHFEPDPAIVGTPFFVMERIRGRIFADASLAGVTPADRTAMYASMVETLVRLHAVDWLAVGLDGYGKPGAYFQRQIKRWTQQWQLHRTRDDTTVDRLIEWLPEHAPAQEETSICHGDYRVGNLIFHPTEPHVVGVLDWELSTLGHPLADLAYNCIAWHTLPAEYGGLLGLPLETLGIPAERDYLGMYFSAAKREHDILPFHYAFALFRLAVIFEGIAARSQGGNAAAPNAGTVGKLSAAFATRAAQFIG